jgi:ESS family glutamate:Na+ symporter
MNLSTLNTLAVALVAMYVGIYLRNKIPFLQKIGVPTPVIGGLLFALIHLILKSTTATEVAFDTGAQLPFMLAFFSVIGLGSSIEGMKRGGRLLIIFWLLSGILTATQAIIGVSLAQLMNIDPLLGLMAGSASLTGGHGSAAAYGYLIESDGVKSGLAVALASATFGLVAGALIGSPLALYLIKKYELSPEYKVIDNKIVGSDKESSNNPQNEFNADNILLHMTMLIFIMCLGVFIADILKSQLDLVVPSYIGAMLVAIIFNNLNLKFQWIQINRKLISIFGLVALQIFLCIALSTMRLWELAELALPLLTILFVQVLFIVCFTAFFVFRLLGKNYDAAVMVAGMCGSGLGATTNAMLNMNEVSNKHGFTDIPYLVVPIAGACLIDIFQIPIIVGVINYFS